MSLILDAVAVLGTLAERLRRSGGGTPDLNPAATLVRDLGRLSSEGATEDLRSVQASIAAVREQLDAGGEPVGPPRQALGDGKYANVYLAGALWAANEFITAQLSARDTMRTPDVGSAMTRRTRVLEIVRSALRDADERDRTISQVDVVDLPAASVLAVRRDEVSRAFLQLVDDRVAVEVATQAGADRRRKHYRLADSSRPTEKTPSKGGAAASRARREQEVVT